MEKIGHNINISFKYDENGVRTQKIVNGIQTDFVTSGIKILAQKTGNNTIVWQVDGNGNTVGFNHNGISYFYMKNLQGDIIGITDTSGNIVAKYTYDSWGKLISIKDANDVDKTTDTGFIGYINPLKYRGYYYDSETGLYYLNARYYDPEVGRFISADETLDGGYNLFEYCLNNPVGLTDKSGTIPSHNVIDKALELANIVSKLSFGKKGDGQQWEYGMFAYKEGDTWSNSNPRTDYNSNRVQSFADIRTIAPKLKGGSINTVIDIHTHPIYLDDSTDTKVWYYQNTFSRGKESDIATSRENLPRFKSFNVKNYYSALVVADGTVFLFDPEANKIYKIGAVAEDPNMKMIRPRGGKECIIV